MIYIHAGVNCEQIADIADIAGVVNTNDTLISEMTVLLPEVVIIQQMWGCFSTVLYLRAVQCRWLIFNHTCNSRYDAVNFLHILRRFALSENSIF